MEQDSPPIGRVVAVGACFVDIILSVPQFPVEDSKLRASSVRHRRGGNCPNTLEVLQQLKCVRHKKYELERAYDLSDAEPPIEFIPGGHDDPNGQLQLCLISVLPDPESGDTQFIGNSLKDKFYPHVEVDTSYCLNRVGYNAAASAYIISSKDTGSRTVVSHSNLPSMTLSEFKTSVNGIHTSEISRRHSVRPNNKISTWYHFEGRDCQDTDLFIRYVRVVAKDRDLNFRVSVELENPHREGLEELEALADIVFYSRSWATHQGYKCPRECIKQQADKLFNRYQREVHMHNKPAREPGEWNKWLFCTWGEDGAAGGHMRVLIGTRSEPEMTLCMTPTQPSWKPPGVTQTKAVDSVGAGDTWIAGMMYAVIHNIGSEKGLEVDTISAKVDFANEIAGRKVGKQGFDNLAWQVWEKI